MLTPQFQKNDAKAKVLIYSVSAVVFFAVVALKYIKLDVTLPFNKHLFADINAVINGAVSVILLLALWQIKEKNYKAHKNLMMTAMLLSIGFLVSYICHHVFSGETHYDGEFKVFYYIVLITHIILAAVILPFILCQSICLHKSSQRLFKIYLCIGLSFGFNLFCSFASLLIKFLQFIYISFFMFNLLNV